MSEKEQQVWQRVMSAKEMPQENSLKANGMISMEAAQEYGMLRRTLQGKPQELATKLWKNEQEIISCIKGLYYLQNGTALQLPCLPKRRNPDQRCLVRRYHCTRKGMTEYMSRSAEAEWGCVFLAMAKIQEAQCGLLTQLLGMM